MASNTVQKSTYLDTVPTNMKNKTGKSGRKRKWVNEWLLAKREELYHTKLCKEEPAFEPNPMGMDETTYRKFLQLLTPLIKKKDTLMRTAITPHERLSATLRYLTTGCSYERLKFFTLISVQSLSRMIPETCEAIIKALHTKYMKFPENENEWLGIAEDFENKWNFPHCVGAIGGKHVRIIPQAATSDINFLNYKNYHSIVFFAIANANYEFIMVDIGTNGGASDALKNTLFYKYLSKGRLHLPVDQDKPYVFVGDEAFPLRENLLKPYPQSDVDDDKLIFNYRLKRVKSVVENMFGILSDHFRIYHSVFKIDLRNVEKIVYATCLLHNFLRQNSADTYTPESRLDQENIDEGELHLGLRPQNESLTDLKWELDKNSFCGAKDVRDAYCSYFNSPQGEVPGQAKMTSHYEKKAERGMELENNYNESSSMH